MRASRLGLMAVMGAALFAETDRVYSQAQSFHGTDYVSIRQARRKSRRGKGGKGFRRK